MVWSNYSFFFGWFILEKGLIIMVFENAPSQKKSLFIKFKFIKLRFFRARNIPFYIGAFLISGKIFLATKPL